MLTELGLQFTFYTDVGCYEESVLYLYDRNPAGRGLDFAYNPEQEEDFLRYAVELHCLNPVQDIARTSSPQLEEIAIGAKVFLAAVNKTGTQQRKDMDAALRTAGTTTDLFPDPAAKCQMNLELNYHLGAEGVMSSGRIQDPEGAKHLVISYRTAAGAIAIISKQKFPIMTYKDALTGKLKVDENMTAGDLRNPSTGTKKLLIYSANMHPRSALNPANCTAKSSPRDRANWIASMLTQLDKFPDTESRT
jgi:hypothetical protein